jgi:hypothetical protein
MTNVIPTAMIPRWRLRSGCENVAFRKKIAVLRLKENQQQDQKSTPKRQKGNGIKTSTAFG